MRITFVLPDVNLGGGTRVLAIYADRLTRRGHKVVVVATPMPRPTLSARARCLLKGGGWPKYEPRTASHFDGLDGVDLRLVDRRRPITDGDVPDADVVIATWWETAEWVAALNDGKGVKAYFVQHYEAFPHLPAERVEATWRLPLRKIAVAQWLVDLARDKFGQEAILVPNGVDTKQFNAPSRGKQPLPTVGVMYSTVAFKGCDIALEALRLASRRVKGLRLVTFGAERPAHHLPLPPNARFVLRPPQDRIKDLYAGADAWLFGSRSEGFGLPLLEAMACRTPVIATPAGAAPELVAQGGGVLVEPENPGAMADAIERVCAMGEEEWKRLSEVAYSVACRYTWDDAVVLFEAALREVVSGGGPDRKPTPAARPAPLPSTAA